MRTMIMLAVAGVAGSVLFAAEGQRTAPPAAASDPPAVAVPAAPAAKQDTATAPAAAAAEAPTPSPTPATTGAVEEETLPPAPTRTGADKAAESSQRFVPSEQVRADFDVSFPIDI